MGGERIVDADSSDDDEVIDVKEWVPDEQLEPLTHGSSTPRGGWWC